MKNQTTTTITVKRKTKAKLKSMLSKNQTFDEILLKLIKKAEYEKFLEAQYKCLSEKSKFVPLEKLTNKIRQKNPYEILDKIIQEPYDEAKDDIKVEKWLKKECI